MATLLQCIDSLIDNISVTDRQEENIKNSVSNIENHLNNSENDLNIDSTFLNGSYERDTIIRPLDDIDIFAILNREDWEDEFHHLPSPQKVLTKIKDYLNSLNDYKDKVKQDRPCVTITLSDKRFDVLPSFNQNDSGFLIPNYDLKSWISTYPLQLTEDLNNTHKNCNYKLKQIIKVVKYWNRLNDKVIPSFHIEEIAIRIFSINTFKNFEEAIRIWFNNAKNNLSSNKFKSYDEYDLILKKINKVANNLNEAKSKYDNNEEGEAIKIWKEIFGKEFPTINIDEAKNFSKSLSEGTLKIGSTGILSTEIGKNVAPSKGFFGEIS